MLIRVCAFTDAGEKTAHKLFDGWTDMCAQYRDRSETLADWTKECFQRRLPILFAGACGIAVRAIAPFVSDKLSDPPVLVMDEKGAYVIPILSGHVGAANELASLFAARLLAKAVVTTATDVAGLFSADVFAVKHGLHILNREGIRLVSARLLRHERIFAYASPPCRKLFKELPPEIPVTEDASAADIWIVRAQELGKGPLPGETSSGNVRRHESIPGVFLREGRARLVLVVKELAVGVGCRKGKSFAELQEFVERETAETVRENAGRLVLPCGMRPTDHIRVFASIDRKKREPGLMNLAQYYHAPFWAYPADELERVRGSVSESEFVRRVTGVPNVCERAALLAAGTDALVRTKCAKNGMTFAAAVAAGIS